MTEKQHLPATERKTVPIKDVDVEIIGVTTLPLRRLAPTGTPQGTPPDEGFETGEEFEGALDKVSRPLKGRFAHVPYTSEDLIREKREEAELEDRSS